MKIQCPKCEGCGMANLEEVCPVCDGKGRIDEEGQEKLQAAHKEPGQPL